MTLPSEAPKVQAVRNFETQLAEQTLKELMQKQNKSTQQ